jgi:uncharacterized phage-associated protein
MNLFSTLHAIRDLLATLYKKNCVEPLNVKLRLPKLNSVEYVRFYARIGVWGRREAQMPLTFRPKVDKIVEALLYVAHKHPGADKYQAVKFFYFADREHIRRYGRPVTFDNYYALWYGPVGTTALDLLNGASPSLFGGNEKVLPFKTEKGTVKTKSGKETETTFIREPLRDVKLDLFSKSDLEILDKIISKYKDASFDDLFNETHNHFAYKNAWRKRRNGDRAEMYYDEMIEDPHLRASLVEDLAPVAAKL